VKVNRIFQWWWNARGKVRANTCCGDHSGEANAEGCCKKNLADVYTTSLGMVRGFGLTKKMDSMVTNKILFLFQSAYVLRMKNPG
jgi:hypothetical protein